MSERTAPGETLSRRLATRSETGLRRKSTPDGGEVYSGPLARQALRSVGARAMTMDETIFVDDDFDINKPEDAAVYAHERFHQEQERQGQSLDNLGVVDAEEMGARAVESMVLHHAASGGSMGDFDTVMRSAFQVARDSMAGPQPVKSGPDGAPRGEAVPEEIYESLRRKGKTHQEIVRELARFVVFHIMDSEEKQVIRTAGASLFR